MRCFVKSQSRLGCLILLMLFVVSIALPGCSSNTASKTDLAASPPAATEKPAIPEPTTRTPATAEPSKTAEEAAPEPTVEGVIVVHFIDVGQGDAILIQLPNGQSMLIDAGDNGLGPTVVSYLRSQGVEQVDYLVATHPHADHIGGMPDVIKTFAIGEVYMPRTTHTTQTYERLLQAIADKELMVTEAKAGLELVTAPNLRVGFAGPARSNYTDLNNWSAVVRIEYGERSFLFTGDAESESEGAMLASSHASLNVDVLKIGHHGSKTSTTDQFLSAVSPSIAVINVGAKNQYGHPAPETLSKLLSASIDIYRTDEHGAIVIRSDGVDLTVQTAKGGGPSTTAGPPTVETTVAPAPTPPSPAPSTEAVTVYITKTGKKYHRDECRYLSQSKIAIRLSDAKARGYTPCTVCKPPQ